MNKNKHEELITDANVSHCVTMHTEPRPLCSVPEADSPSTGPEIVSPIVGHRDDEQSAQDIVDAMQNMVDFAGRKSGPIASEEGHWYLQTGKPFYTYVNAKGETKPVTLRQARPVNAYPSVTTVTKIADRPALNNYFERHIFDAALRLLKDYDPVDWLRRGLQFPKEEADELFTLAKKASRDHRDAKAARGTALHAEIEWFLRGDPIGDRKWKPHLDNLVSVTTQYGLNLSNGEPEHSFAHKLGFGGKVDYHEQDSAREWIKGRPILGTDGLVIDFKSKDTIEPGKRYAYDEHAMQLAAYREGLGIPSARCLNIFIGEEDCQILIHEWPEEDLNRGWRMFKLFLRAWKEKHYYWPKLI